MPARSAPWWIAVLVALGAAGESSALAAPAEAVHFSYEAPPNCPTEAQFFESIREDGGAFTRAPEGPTTREFHVRITQGDPISGQLVVREPGGSAATRTIAGARCQDVAQALAVLVSLALASESDGAPVVAAPVRPAPVSRKVEVDSPPADRSLEPLPPGWRLGLSAEGVVGGLGSLGLGLAAYVEVIRDVPDGFAPALRLGVEVAQGDAGYSPNADFSGDGVSLSRRVVRLDACPLRLVAVRPWSPSPLEAWVCARLDAGVLDVSAPNLPTPSQIERAWMAAASLVHVRWVARRLFVDLEGGVGFPLLRERFYVEPSTSAYQVPTVTGTGGLAVGVYFL